MWRVALGYFLLNIVYYATFSEAYLVGAGLNVRFAQMLQSDTKYKVLREEMIKANTRNLAYHCRADKSDCDAALAKMRYKASKHFYALSKAVVDYVKNRRQARPTGYVEKLHDQESITSHQTNLLKHTQRVNSPLDSNIGACSGNVGFTVHGCKGTATFCQDNICVPDTDPPIVYGGCFTLISCGGNQTWFLDPVVYKKRKNKYY